MSDDRSGDPQPIAHDAQQLHDMRQPLAALLAAATALKANADVDAATRERLLTIIVTNTERLSEMLTEAFGRP